jgi:serine/threonine-protein kinase
MTTPGLVLGTVHYVSPEQAAGLQATPASDVYGLGVVLYEMLSGTVPFDAESSVGVAMRILGEDPVPVQQLNPRVPPALAAIVGKAMARRPEDRYPDAGALADALSGYSLRSEQVTGALPEGSAALRSVQRSAEYPGPETRRSSLDRTGLLLGFVTLVAVGGLIPLWLAVLARVEAAPVLQLPMSRPTAAPTQSGPESTVDATAALSGLLVPVPAVDGLDAADGRGRLEAQGLGVTEPREPSDTVPAGRIIRQSPSAAERVPKGTIVEMVVSEGPALRVPSITGDYATIADALVALGFEPVRRDRWSGAGGEVGKVLGLDPPPGTMWPAGSPVQVNVDSGSYMPIGADFENGLHLRGIDLPRVQVAPGDTLSLVSTWEASSQIAGDFMVRALLVSSDGQEIGRAELAPGDRPTSTWQIGERFTSSRFDLPVDASVAPGEYGLWLEVWPASDPAGALPVRSRGMARSVNGARLLLAPVQIG